MGSGKSNFHCDAGVTDDFSHRHGSAGMVMFKQLGTPCTEGFGCEKKNRSGRGAAHADIVFGHSVEQARAVKREDFLECDAVTALGLLGREIVIQIAAREDKDFLTRCRLRSIKPPQRLAKPTAFRLRDVPERDRQKGEVTESGL